MCKRKRKNIFQMILTYRSSYGAESNCIHGKTPNKLICLRFPKKHAQTFPQLDITKLKANQNQNKTWNCSTETTSSQQSSTPSMGTSMEVRSTWQPTLKAAGGSLQTESHLVRLLVTNFRKEQVNEKEPREETKKWEKKNKNMKSRFSKTNI